MNWEQRNRIIKHAAQRDPFGVRDVLTELSEGELDRLGGDLRLAAWMTENELQFRSSVPTSRWFASRGRPAT